MYSVDFARSARKELETFPDFIQIRIIDKIEALRSNPRPSGSKKIRGTDNAWRIRIGDYRAIYEVDEVNKTIDVAVVSHRQSAYKE